MPRYRSSVDVPVPPAEAFAFVADFTNATRWDPMVERAEKETPGPVRVGTRFVLFSRVLGRSVELPYEVVEMEAGEPPGSAGPEEPRRLVLEGRSRLFRYRDEIDFEPTPGGSRIHYDADLSFRGPLVLGNLALRPVLRRAGDDALEGIVRLLRRPGGTPSAVPPPAGVTPREVGEIAALEDRPALRNLLITRGYHLLSRRLGELLGTGDANWCTYATWASKTAGFFIREEEVDAELRRWLERKARLRKRLRAVHRALREAHPEAGLYEDGDELGPVLEVSGEVGRWIRAGNKVVFEELGGLFAAYLEEYAPKGVVDDARLADPGRLEAFLDRHLRPGEVRPDRVERRGDELVSAPKGGQDLLRQAIRCYHRALRAERPKDRSELILLGNALGGLHEQTRLQTYIAGSLGAPVEEVLYSRRNDALLQRLGQRLGQAALGDVQEVFHRAFAPLGEEVARRVREFSTLHLMRMPIPGEVLELGEDLPAPRGGPLFPPALEVLEDGELVEVLTRYGVYPRVVAADHPWLRLRARVTAQLVRLGLHPPVVAGSAAEDWSDLGQRMRYIFCYFRSRQSWPPLFGPPFTEAQEAALLGGRIPPPPL